MLPQAELETEGLRLATIFGLPPTPRGGLKYVYSVISVIFDLLPANTNMGRAAAEDFSPTSPRAPWIGPEQRRILDPFFWISILF